MAQASAGVRGVVDSFGNEIPPSILTKWVERVWKAGGDLGTDLRGKIEIMWMVSPKDHVVVAFTPPDHPDSADTEWRPWSMFDVERMVAFVEAEARKGAVKCP